MLRVLVVDDEHLLRELMRDALAVRGWTVEAAADADVARRLAASDAFDVAIVDVHLTGPTSGIELCRELVASRPGIPVLLVSGHDAPAVQEAGRAAGARGFVSKPFRPSELLAAVEDAVADPG